MNKFRTGIAVMAAACLMSGVTVFAAEAAVEPKDPYVNGDGICAYCGASCAFVDTDGDGICDNYGTNGCGLGAGYVDADGDGICDNYGTNGCGRGGRGRGCGRRWR